MIHNLEAAAQKLAAETGCSIQVARVGVRVELAKMAIERNFFTVAEANAYLAPYGVSIKTF